MIKVQKEVMDFNYAPNLYIDQTWLKDFDHGDILLAFLSSESTHHLLARIILDKLQILKEPEFEFDGIKKIALQSKSVITQIVFHIGLVANSSFFRTLIRRHERNLVKTNLGDKAFDFALKKAPLIGGMLPQQFATTIKVDWEEPDFIKKHVFRSGMRILGAIFSKEKEGFIKRFLLKLPKPSQDYFYLGASDLTSNELRKSAVAVLKKLIREFGA